MGRIGLHSHNDSAVDILFLRFLCLCCNHRSLSGNFPSLQFPRSQYHLLSVMFYVDLLANMLSSLWSSRLQNPTSTQLQFTWF